jgi:primosomal protein N' (replication factor Y)
LTYHKNSNTLACHLCGHEQHPPTFCPGCNAPQPMKYQGIGTELVEKSLQAIFPDARTLRIDADTTRHKGSHQKLLRAFGTGKADILIGTQMIAKGLHFPAVTLVGVLNTDSALNIPDFRASETVFQLITQVAGRAGRGALAGEVLIQTHMPDNNTIRLAAAQQYDAFYDAEIAARQMFGYPPTMNMVKLGFYGEDREKTHRTATHFQEALQGILGAHYQVHPVMPCGYAKVKNQYRYQFLVRGNAVASAVKAIGVLKERLTIPKTVKMHIDVNPVSTYF